MRIDHSGKHRAVRQIDLLFILKLVRATDLYDGSRFVTHERQSALESAACIEKFGKPGNH